MIYIFEDTPIKISGRSSIFIFSAYSEAITKIIKEENLAIWHKKKNLWELPICSLSDILDKLTYLDDITLNLLPDDEPLREPGKLTLSYKLPPLKYQEEGIKFGLEHDSWLLLDEAGLGKTYQMIHLAEELKAQRGIKHCLIICGIATLRANWEKEIEKHCDLSYITIGKRVNKNNNINWMKMEERANQLKNNIDEFFTIINIESIRDDRVVDAINNSENQFDMIVFDEVHKSKNKQSAQSTNLLKIKQGKYRIGLSGTLIMNSPVDAYLPLNWIGVDKSNLTNFKKLYCEFGGFGGYEIIGSKNLDILKDEIEHNSLRRTKDMIKDLPSKTIIDEYVEMSEEHAKFYNDVKKGVKEECDKIKLNTNNLLALTTRLKQATTCPSVLTSNNIESSKINRCIDLVEDIISQGDKVVIISTFKEPIYRLRDLLSQYSPLVGTGDEKDADVSKRVDLFQTDDKYKIFLGTIQKMGTGITLNKARYMIMLDEPFTFALYSQATDRIHRINNTESVFIYNLICERTIDERVSKIINRKKAISKYVIDDAIDDDSLIILKNYILDL